MIIGIGGVSRSGKGQLAKTIEKLYTGKDVVVLSQDDYVIPASRIPRIKGEIDWERPESMDFDKFYQALVKARRDADLVVGEGILVFYTPALYHLFDRKIFITISRSVFRRRKVKDHRWGSFPDWYVDHIWTSYQKYGKIPSGRRDVLYLNGVRPFPVHRIRDYLDSGRPD